MERENKVKPHAKSKNYSNLSSFAWAFMRAPRCGAKTRKGISCRAPAMRNGRCRLHGGKSSGPRTTEGIEKIRQAHLKHGLYTKDVIASRKEFSNLLRQLRETIKETESQGEKVNIEV